MNKLKKKYIIKNKNYAQKNQNVLKIYNAIILYKNKKFNILEFTDNKNIYIPIKKKIRIFILLIKKLKIYYLLIII